jgi:hypothetical protein
MIIDIMKTSMKKSLFIVLVIIGLSGVMVLGSTLGTISTPIQTVYSSSAQGTSDDEDQPDEPRDDEPADEPEPEPEPEPAVEPADETNPEPLDDNGGLIEKEKECTKGEYDNNGKCTKIPNCVYPETWSPTLEICRVFPWWLTLR